jgi:hypothetical protein
VTNPKMKKMHKYVTTTDGMDVKEIANEIGMSIATVSYTCSTALRTLSSEVLKAFDETPTRDRVDNLAFDPTFVEIIREAFRRNDAEKLQKARREAEDKDMIESITHLCGSHRVNPD